ncbi:MAG: PDZ domain-containing protein [Pirellula sp.]|jgi:serine protease Do|nr:PDZ domain-containing protein [Pirellula sp.]
MRSSISTLKISQWIFCIAGIALLSSSESKATQSLDELEQQALQAAGDFAQEYTVQVEAFGGQEFVNRQAVASGPSTGTVLTPDGWIASSTFYFRGQPASITVLLPNGDRKPAKLVARDHNREIALLKIETDQPLKAALPSASGNWQVGQWTLALGKTFDVRIASRSVGILSAMGRVFDKAIQTDCKISPQNYGGPLVDLKGETMGILTLLNPAIATEGEVEQWYDSGVGFAIPIQDILERLPTLQAGTDIYPGKIGVRTQGKDEFKEGITLIGLSPGGPAAKAGMQAGDKITKVGRTPQSLKPVATYMQFRHAINPIDAGQSIAIEVDRAGSTTLFEMTMAKELPEYKEPYLGIATLREPDSSERILHVIKDSPADKAGLVPGDIVTKWSGLPLVKEKGLRQHLWFHDFRSPAALTIKQASGEEKSVNVDTTSRPTGEIVVPEIAFPLVETNEAAPETSVQQIPMGDVRNRAFAIVPNSYRSTTPHGLLLVFSEAGPADPKVWSTYWEKFAAANRWIVVVLQSADEQEWTFEEMEIASRAKGHLLTNFSIDRNRVVVGGIASGAVLGIITAVQQPGEYLGLWVGNGKLNSRIRLTSPEPGESVRFFLNGTDPSIKELSEIVAKAGYNVNFYEHDIELNKENVSLSPALEKLQRWLQFQEIF